MGEYVLDSGSDLGREQLGYLAHLLDGPTTDALAPVCPPGARCLDLGAGNGSVTRWMAERVRTPGRVTAVDIDDRHLDVPASVTVHRRDINEGLPTASPYDLVHTRLLLMHLGRRSAVLRELSGALAPGGWLVVGDQTYAGVRVLSAPSPADAELFRSIVDTTIERVGKPAGIDYGWADTVAGEMAAAGLGEIDTLVHHRTVRGGGAGMLLYGNYVRQVETHLLALGVTAAELRRFHEILLDPDLCVWWFPFVCTRGRRPAAAGSLPRQVSADGAAQPAAPDPST